MQRRRPNINEILEWHTSQQIGTKTGMRRKRIETAASHGGGHQLTRALVMKFGRHAGVWMPTRRHPPRISYGAHGRALLVERIDGGSSGE